MKKLKSAEPLTATSFLANTQNTESPAVDIEILKIGIGVFVMGIVMVFVLIILKRIMDYRLKNKIIEKGVPENIALSVLGKTPKEDKNSSIKWFSILTGLGAGLTITYYTTPLGIHSLAIMAFCIAVSFLAYFFFLNKSEQQDN